MTDPLVPVIGSRTRAYALAVLAGTRLPLTAYRVAKLADLSPPNVYLELRRLGSAGVVERTEGGWTLVDERVRAFCEGQGPLFEKRFSIESKEKWTAMNRDRIARLRRWPAPKGGKWSGPVPKLMREFNRSPTKNELLKAAGLRTSRHKGR
jgi:DNA-binding transcriptional ArsR family regulator